jgi:hypothetical protein
MCEKRITSRATAVGIRRMAFGRASPSSRRPLTFAYQTLHAFFVTIGFPSPQLNARPNCGRFTTTPLIRYLLGECGLVIALARRFSGR